MECADGSRSRVGYEIEELDHSFLPVDVFFRLAVFSVSKIPTTRSQMKHPVGAGLKKGVVLN